MPKISVIVPVYNGEKYLDKCVSSILNQSFGDLELIIVDDGSKDNTAEICKGFAAADSRVRVIHQQNAGVSQARNTGLQAIGGEFISFVDADDFIEPDTYREMMDAIVTSTADSCACGHYNFHPDGTRDSISAPLKSGFYTPDETYKAIVFPLLADRLSRSPFLGTACRYLFNAKAIAQRGLVFSGAYLEDELFILEYFSLPHTLACVDKPFYNYYQNPSSVTHRYLEGFVDIFLDTLERKARLIEEFSIPVPDYWKDNCAWAGLLIAISNEYAPGNNKSFGEKLAEIKKICREPVFEHARKNYAPSDMSRNKAIVAKLLRLRLYLVLAILYTYKNRNWR